MNAIVPRPTIEQIVAARNAAIGLYGAAWQKIAEADEAIKEAAEMAARCSPGINGYNYNHQEEIQSFHQAVTLPDRDRYLRTARKLIDINAWAWIIERTDLERLMDKEAKEKLRSQMAYVPERTDRRGQIINEEEIAKGLPELTVENVMATLEGFLGESDMIFRRGIANVFSSLDRRFRSHDGFKIGSRIILTYAFDGYGYLNYGRVRDQVMDIERVFAVLDGVPESNFRSALGAMEKDRSRAGIHGRRQSEVETEYLRIKGYMNGNAHLWFTRNDLVDKVNKLLGEWYGEVIGDGATQEADPFEDVKHLPAKRFGFYPTPDAASERVGRLLNLHRDHGQEPLAVLEPSAGTGNLARLAARTISNYTGWGAERIDYSYRACVDCVEIQPHLAGGLEGEGIYRRVFCQDFLRLSPDTTGLYDRVVMNPPFDRERDIDHVMHAMKFLKEDGQLVAIMSAGTEFRETKKSVAFREVMARLNADWEDLPAGSFSEAGTNVNTLILRVWKDGRKTTRW